MFGWAMGHSVCLDGQLDAVNLRLSGQLAAAEQLVVAGQLVETGQFAVAEQLAGDNMLWQDTC